VSKSNLRIAAYGTVDETNAVLGMVRLHTATPDLALLDAMLVRIQNELFDLGADLCVPDRGEVLPYEPLRMTAAQATRLESEIDTLNADLQSLRSFVLPGGHPAAAHLHLARTVARRAERQMVALKAQEGEPVGDAALTVIDQRDRLPRHREQGAARLVDRVPHRRELHRHPRPRRRVPLLDRRRRVGQQRPRLLGVGHHQLRLVDRYRSRRHAHQRRPLLVPPEVAHQHQPLR
jgi:cob(I)alamin adenosyltransferase